MQSIAQLLAKKPAVVTVAPHDSVRQALEVLATHNIGAVPVLDGHRLVGIFSERDYARKVALKGLASTSTTVQEVMSSQVRCARLDDTVMGCMDLMTQKHIRHLPVLEDQRLLGILSIGDLVKAVIEDQQFQIKQLEEYIRA
jgi:CBS domain-containing protein